MASIPIAHEERSLLNHGPGKGDKDRSPGWRKHYDEIDWGVVNPAGFQSVGVRQVKVYRPKQHCHANDDGLCYWPHCPNQVIDGEPARSGGCPLQTGEPAAQAARKVKCAVADCTESALSESAIGGQWFPVCYKHSKNRLTPRRPLQYD